MTPADELYAAAKKIHTTALHATKCPWSVGKRIDDKTGDRSRLPIVAEIEVENDEGEVVKADTWPAVVEYHHGYFQFPHGEAETDAQHIALWHPGVAELVATWLRATADDMSDEHAHVVDHPEWVGCAADQRWGVYAVNSRLDCEPWKRALIVARAINGEREASATQPLPTPADADLYLPEDLRPAAPDEPKPRVRMGDTCGPEHTYREFCQYAGEVQ